MQSRTNKVVRINFAGGLLGLIFGSHRGKLEAVISQENSKGWNLAEYIPDNPNLALLLLRLVLLVLTLGLWTIATGYILVFEKPVASTVDDTRQPNLRAEPKISARPSKVWNS